MRDSLVNSYAFFICDLCPESARFPREGGNAALDRHSFLFHPGQEPQGRVETRPHPTPNGRRG